MPCQGFLTPDGPADLGLQVDHVPGRSARRANPEILDRPLETLPEPGGREARRRPCLHSRLRERQ